MAGLLHRDNRQHLISAACTIGGIFGEATLERRAAAAAQAGFRKLGMTREQYLAERAAGRTDADLRAILAHHGIQVVEIEGLYGWASTGEGPGLPGQPRVDWRERESDLYQLADAVGAEHMVCAEAGFFGPLLPIDGVAERFAGVADRAQEHGLKVVLEFLPFAGIPDCAAAWEVVRRADRANAGILFDTWHFFKGAADFDQLRTTPPEKIMLIQICDGRPPYGDLLHDTVHSRKLPGEGKFDLKGVLTLLHHLGVQAPISVEVLSDELAALPPETAAQRAYAATRDLLNSIPVEQG